VSIDWIENSRHRLKVQVPVRTDFGDFDLANQLAELDDGFIGVERVPSSDDHVAATRGGERIDQLGDDLNDQ
jgi:hypothetical protein